jgi:hypothetical protein
MTSAEEYEAGRKAAARHQGHSAAIQGASGAAGTKLPNQAPNDPASIETAAKAMEPKVDASATELLAANTAEPGGSNAPPGGTATNVATPAHDKDMAKMFLAALDPNASRFTFQFFNDHEGGYAEIVHGTLDEVWPKVQALNTRSRGVGVFVTINETDLRGRNTKNMLRGRALFVDADSKEQGKRCFKTFSTYDAAPSMAVSSGRGWHFYFLTDVPRDQFSPLQKSLIDKVGTDPAIKDLPRVMRLPGTLHLKKPADPRLVKLLGPPNLAVRRWQLADLVAKLGLCSVDPASAKQQQQSGGSDAIGMSAIQLPESFKNAKPAQLFAFLDPDNDNLADGIRTTPWFEALSPELKDEVVDHALGSIAKNTQLLELEADGGNNAEYYNVTTSVARSGAPNAEDIFVKHASGAKNADPEEALRQHFSRCRASQPSGNREITVGTLLRVAQQNGAAFDQWKCPAQNVPVSPALTWSAAELNPSFANIPHRRWLYGTYLIRGEVTVLAAPGGAGKTALATGIAVEIITGIEVLAEKIFGGNLKVLFINGEDGRTEIERRVCAFYRAHADKLAGQSLSRLYVAGADDARVQRLSFLRTTDSNFSTLDPSGFEVLKSGLETLRPDVLILDPLVAFCGGGNMNDNAVMAQVIRELKQLAAKFDCAVLIIHHTRKGADDGNAEAISGASATVNLARRALMPVLMTQKEAEQLFVPPSERFRYFKLVDAKSNLAPRSSDSPWYRLHSIELPNAEPPVYPHGDNVQAVQRVNLAVLQTAPPTTDEQKIRDAILDLINRGKLIDGRPYPYSPSPAGASKERALLDDAMAAVRDATVPREWHPDDLKAATVGAIKKMKAEELLIEKDMKELMPNPGRFRKGRGLAVASMSPVAVQATSGDQIAAAEGPTVV